jgi:hypothetical protein
VNKSSPVGPDHKRPPRFVGPRWHFLVQTQISELVQIQVSERRIHHSAGALVGMVETAMGIRCKLLQ